MIYVEIWHDDMPQHPMMRHVKKWQASFTGEFSPQAVEPLSSPVYLETVLKSRRRDYLISYKKHIKFIVWFSATPHLDASIQTAIQALITDIPNIVLTIITSKQDDSTANFLRALPRVIYRVVNWDDADAIKAEYDQLIDNMDEAAINSTIFLDKFLPQSQPPAPISSPPPPPTFDDKTLKPPTDYNNERRGFARTLMRRPSPTKITDRGIKLRPVTFGVIPAPKNDPFYYPEDIPDFSLGVLMNGVQWAMGGASRRGNSHQHKGTPRDDAMYFGAEGPWNIIAVADGAGSAKFSRKTANDSVMIACEVIREFANHANLNDIEASKDLMRQALTKALGEIHDSQTQFTRQQNLDKRDTYCTLLILIHQPLPSGGCVFASFQAGDGYMMGMSHERTSRIAKGDHGAEVGTSQFVLSFTKEELEQRITTFSTDKNIHTFMLVTDGIEDDLKVSHDDYQKGYTIDDKAARFATGVRNILINFPLDHWGELLLKEICYEVVGSNDDRTIVILTPLPTKPTPFYG